MIADMINNEKLNPLVTKLWGEKLIISTAFITQSYLKVSKEIGPKTTHLYYENS